MPAPISMAIRQSIVESYQRGERISTLARTFGVSRRSVYSFINRAKSSSGEEALRTHYANCGKPRPTAQDFIFRAVRCLRTWHPDWGSEKIRAEMLSMRPDLELPHYRTFTRWFHWNGQISPTIRSRLPKATAPAATRLHECWQVDAKEELSIADGSCNCWLNITDESSGTVIQPPVFSH
jgi:transposase